MAALIRSTAATSAYFPSNLSSPTKPHIIFSARARLRPIDAVFLLVRDRRKACLPSLVVQTASGLRLADARGGPQPLRWFRSYSFLSDDPGVLGASAAGGVHHQAPLGGDSGQRQRSEGAVVVFGAPE